MKKIKTISFTIAFLGLLMAFILIMYEKHEILGDNQSTEEPKPILENSKKANLTIVGDFLYEEPYYAALKNGEDENLYFSKVKKYFQNDDLSIGNMEVVIGNDSLKTSGSNFSFCAPPSIGRQVIDLGMDVLSTANNHSNDRGLDGRISTIDFYKENSDILTVGTYKEDRNILNNIREINDIKFGFLAYTYGTNIKIPSELRDGIGLYRDPDGKEHAKYENLMKEEISFLRKHVDVLIVIMHWGVEFTYTPKETERNLASMMNDLGVDIIIGSHSHSIEPIEWIRSDKGETLVYYSMGNFVSADDDISRTGETFDNAYQMGLLSTLQVEKNKNGIYIKDIKTTPIINYFDTNMRNFQLVPLDEYTEDLEKSHFRYKYNFNRKFIEQAYMTIISNEFR